MADNIQPSKDDTFKRTMDSMRAAQDSYLAGTIDQKAYEKELVRLDYDLSGQIKSTFNAQSGIMLARPQYSVGGFEFGDDIDLRASMKDQHKKFVHGSDGFENDRDILDALRKNSPDLAHLDMEQSALVLRAHIAGDTVADTRTLLFASLYVKSDPANIKEVDPALASYVKAGDGAAKINSYIIFNGVYQNPTPDEFKSMEAEQRKTLLKAMNDHPNLNERIAQIEPLTQINSKEEFKAQYDLRHEIAQDIAEIYGKVYNMPNITREDVYSPYLEYTDDKKLEHLAFQASTHGTGVQNDEFIALNSNITAEFFHASPIKTNQQAANAFLNTVHEELKHLVDEIYAEDLLAGRMKPDAPAHVHAQMIAMNALFMGSDGQIYEKQYLEKTAKAHAEEVANKQTAPLNTPDIPAATGPAQNLSATAKP